MTVNLLFFASWKELTGCGETTLEVEPGATVEQALAAVVARWPAIEERVAYVATAVNEKYAGLDRVLEEGDSLAIIPPVSGGCADHVRVTTEPLGPGELIVSARRPECGAICTFVGTTRDHHEGKSVEHLDYEAYEPMAERELWGLVAAARKRWDLGEVLLEHRLGRVPIGEASVVIVVSAAHRRETFAACEFLIDRLKEVVPIWKRESYRDHAAWLEGEERHPAREE
jgi:molybdopterin synthase catalytic subunit